MKELIAAAKAKALALQNASKVIAANGFATTNAMIIKGAIIQAVDRVYYQQVLFLSEQGEEFTFLNKIPENSNLIASDNVITLTVANGVKHNDQIWIVKAE